MTSYLRKPKTETKWLSQTPSLRQGPLVYFVTWGQELIQLFFFAERAPRMDVIVVRTAKATLLTEGVV